MSVFWVGYLTNGKHLGWYASVQYTLIAAMFGGLVALLLGLVAAAAAQYRAVAAAPGSPPATSTSCAACRTCCSSCSSRWPSSRRVEWLWSTQVCTPETLAANTGHWPPCPDANWRITNVEYLVLACVSLGIVYGAFVANVISGALRAVPPGQLEAARAYGMSRLQVLRRVHVRQMWVYALPGLSNVWMSLLKATSLLSLLQIIDFVTWAQRLGAANISRAAGLVHDDWRWRYYLVLLLFYILVTFVSEKVFAAIIRPGAPRHAHRRPGCRMMGLVDAILGDIELMAMPALFNLYFAAAAIPIGFVLAHLPRARQGLVQSAGQPAEPHLHLLLSRLALLHPALCLLFADAGLQPLGLEAARHRWARAAPAVPRAG